MVVGSFSVHHIRGYMISICLITSDINLDYLIKVVPVSFLYFKVTIVLFVSNTYLGEDNLRLYKYADSLQNFCHFLVAFSRSFQQQFLLFFNDNFLLSAVLLHLLSIFSIRKICSFFTYLYQYELINIYFVLWVIIQYYCYLFYFIVQLISFVM